MTQRGMHRTDPSSRRPATCRPGGCRGFSLVELLVVIALIMLLSVIAVPAIRGISGGTGITSAAEEFMGAVHLARQRASTFNRQVAIRFWKSGNHFVSYQIWEQQDSADPTSWRATERERRFQPGVVVTSHPVHSSMLGRNTGTANGREYADVLFTPAGALVASPNQTAVTFIPSAGPQGGGAVPELPPNFASVIVDPLNGLPRLYRP